MLYAVQGDKEDHNDTHITIPPSPPMASWTQTQHQAYVTFTSGNVQSLHLYVIHPF